MKPKEASGWSIISLTGGWLKFNPHANRSGQVDAHCAWHKGCKMDRAITRRAVGLHTAWLAAGEDPTCTAAKHDELKWILSQESEFERRQVCRLDTCDFAALKPDEHPLKKLLEAEALATGFDNTEEPPSVPCPIPAALRLPKELRS